jgi:S1-C subfamily serine protease
MKYPLILGFTIAFVLAAHAAQSKTAAEVKEIARASTVKISLQKNKSVGSGEIVHRQGDLYTLVTNRHVVCGGWICSNLPAGETYYLTTADGQQHPVKVENVKLFGGKLDLARIQFRSPRNYRSATVAPSNSLKLEDNVYTAGFPSEQPGFSWGAGQTKAVVNKRLTSDGGGYTVIYNADTLPGMSGGGVFDREGRLVAIHGQGDRFRNNTELKKSLRMRVNAKIGINRGIPIRWVVQGLDKQIDLKLVSRKMVVEVA